MFEYTALVDAPVKRFTSIVTDPEPEDAPVLAVAMTGAPIADPVVDTPAAAVAVHPERAEPMQAIEGIERIEPIDAPTLLPPQVVTVRPFAQPRGASSKPSFLPALIGLAAAGVTAMWWLRRDSHDR